METFAVRNSPSNACYIVSKGDLTRLVTHYGENEHGEKGQRRRAAFVCLLQRTRDGRPLRRRIRAEDGALEVACALPPSEETAGPGQTGEGEAGGRALRVGERGVVDAEDAPGRRRGAQG